MGRIIAAVIVGYLAMALFVMLSFSVAYLFVGADRAYQPGTYDVSGLWIGISLPLSVIAAVVGGYVCILIGRTARATKALSIVVVVLGLLSAIPAFLPPNANAPTIRDGSVSNFEACSTRANRDGLRC